MTELPKQETPAESLARSAFGFAFVALIPMVITWVGFTLSPPSPNLTFAQLRLLIVIGFGLLTLLMVGVTVQLFRTPTETLLPTSERIATILSRRWLAGSLVLLLLEANLLAFLLLVNIAPAITNPAKFLTVCWSLLLAGIVFIVNRQALSAWITHTRSLWLGTGLAVIGLAIVLILFAINTVIIQVTGIDDALRGGLDYRELTFYDDGQPLPSAQDFWQEQAQTQVRWSPYTYWVVDEFHGEYINVNADGLRFTPEYAASDAQDIFVFGGSTVWGEGARDAYTIPGHLARLFQENGTPRRVVNFGQTGYVSTQDVIWFQLQITNDNAPDVAIFYQGFNDVLSAWGQGLTGVSLQENARLNDSEAGRILRNGQPVLRLPNQSLEQYDMTLAGVDDMTAASIANRWFANVELVKTLVAGYDVEVLFVWQPAIIFKDPLTPTEQGIIERWENERQGLFDLYADVDAIVRERAAEDEHILILSDLFAGQDQTIFHDLVHITEVGNALVAEAIMPDVLNLIEE